MSLSINDPTTALKQLNTLSQRIQKDPVKGPKAQNLLGKYLKTIKTVILPQFKINTELTEKQKAMLQAWTQCVNFAKPFAPKEQEVSTEKKSAQLPASNLEPQIIKEAHTTSEPAAVGPSLIATPSEPVLENPTPSAAPKQEDSKQANPAEPLVTVPSKTTTVSTSAKTTPVLSSYFSGRKVLAFGAFALAGAVAYASESPLESTLICGALGLIAPVAVKYISRAIQNQPTTPVQTPKKQISAPISAPTPKLWTPADFRASEQRGAARGELREQIRNRLSPTPSPLTYVTPLFDAECVPQSDLGLQFTQLNQDEFLVSKKDENSLFDQLGFKEGDIIKNNPSAIKETFDRFKQGENIKLNISRNIDGISRPAILVICSLEQEDTPPVRKNSIPDPTLSFTSPPPASSTPLALLPPKSSRQTVNSSQTSAVAPKKMFFDPPPAAFLSLPETEEATENDQYVADTVATQDAPLTMEEAVQNFNAAADKHFGNIIAEPNAQLAKINETFMNEWQATALKPNVVPQTVVSKTASSAAAPEKVYSDAEKGNVQQFHKKLTAILGNTDKMGKYRELLLAANKPGNKAQYDSLMRDFLPKTDGNISVPLSVKPSAHVTISGRIARKPAKKRVAFKAN